MIKIIISTFIISIVSLNFVFSDETKLPPSQFQTSTGGFQKKLKYRFLCFQTEDSVRTVRNLENKIKSGIFDLKPFLNGEEWKENYFQF